MTDRYLADPKAPTRANPWVIRYILADLDGTRMSSYNAFQAFELLVAWFHDQLQQDRAGCHTELTRELAMVVRAEVGVEALLHNPEDSLRRVAMTYARSNAPARQHQVANAQFLASIPGLLAACEESFRFFPGAEDFCIHARAARTAFGIFTATAPEHAVNRMIRAGENPELIQEIWSRSSSDQELEGHFDWPNATTDQRAFINLLRPYKDSKPHPGPLRAVHEQYELAPQSILMIGEGIADLGCVLEHPDRLTQHSRLYAHFAFQRQGAALTERFAGINAELREGHPLGLTCFGNLYPEADRHPGIIILQHGFQTLLAMVANGLVVLNPTPPPLRDSDLAHNIYRRRATPALRRARMDYPIETNDGDSEQP